jgi:hypothetical protein
MGLFRVAAQLTISLETNECEHMQDSAKRQDRTLNQRVAGSSPARLTTYFVLICGERF